MPRAFTADETERIDVRLKAAAAEAFARRGVRGTTVEELARSAGISKGAFYRFYDSKEALLLAVLDELELAMHAEIEAAVRAEPGRGLDVLVDTALGAVRSNPLLNVVMSEEGLRVIQSLPEPRQKELLERDSRLVERVATVLRESGAGVSEPVLLALLRSLVFVGLHQDAVGPALVEELSHWIKRSLRADLAR